MLTVLLMISFVGLSANDNLSPGVRVVDVVDFHQLAETAKKQQKLIMLEIAASYCSYCTKIEEEGLKPMLISGDYDADVLIRKIDIDNLEQIRGFDGRPTSGSILASHFDIKVTPTLIFLNSENEEVSTRIVGVNSLDFFGSYVDEAIEHGLTVIR